MDEYTQRGRFNIHTYRLFTAGQLRGTTLSRVELSLNTCLGCVSETQNLLCSAPTFRGNVLPLPSKRFFSVRLCNVVIGGVFLMV